MVHFDDTAEEVRIRRVEFTSRELVQRPPFARRSTQRLGWAPISLTRTPRTAWRRRRAPTSRERRGVRQEARQRKGGGGQGEQALWLEEGHMPSWNLASLFGGLLSVGGRRTRKRHYAAPLL